MTKKEIAPWVAQRIVHFFNTVDKPIEIVAGVLDDPGDDDHQTINMQLARRILLSRESLPTRRFENLAQIDAVPGVGPDKIDDLAFTFGTPASEALERSLFEESVLLENWTLLRYEWSAGSREEFHSVVDHSERFREVVRQLAVRAAMETKGLSEEEALLRSSGIKSDFIDRYTNSTEEAAYAFALWFYRFDADNWFTFDEMLDHMHRFFDYHAYPFSDMELRFFKGFDNSAFVDLVTAPDLPVTVDNAEKVITLWVVGLAD